MTRITSECAKCGNRITTDGATKAIAKAENKEMMERHQCRQALN